MPMKCTNFLVCPCEISSKVEAKVEAKVRAEIRKFDSRHFPGRQSTIFVKATLSI